MTDLNIDPNAPCIFCSNIPTTTTEVRIGSSTTIGEVEISHISFAPVCFECERRFNLFKIIWWSVCIILGQISAFTVVYYYPSKYGFPHESIGTFFGTILVGVFYMLPLIFIYRVIYFFTYGRRARKWLSKYSNSS